MSVELDQFRDEVNRLAAVIGAPERWLPTYGHSDEGARPHIEYAGGQFHYVVCERGVEQARRSSTDRGEILYRVFEALTSAMATAHECRHRRPGEDVRRQMFDVQLALMGRLSGDWQRRTREHLDAVLRRHPFSD